MLLRIYVAGYGDTLRTIASKYETETEVLLALNLQIPDPDQLIHWTQIRLPPPVYTLHTFLIRKWMSKHIKRLRLRMILGIVELVRNQ
ncbi:LysM domain-containing protein [Paenibacillus sp. LHD-38]|uniref:LysM peptidoglycan-binding domain-containing protein n=1 Tax=Paenibacillus sp. LHD-38 TaxID=3072143 RepID=UPI0035BE6780